MLDNDSKIAGLPEPIKFEADKDVEPIVVAEEKPQYTEFEVKAMEQGWTPLDKFKGDIADFKGARAFLKDGEYISRHQSQIKKMDEMERSLSYLVDHNKKIEAVTREKTIAELRLEQARAAEIGNAQRVLELTDRITNATSVAAPVVNETHDQRYKRETAEEFTKFRSRNAWFDGTIDSNDDKIKYAKEQSASLLITNPELSPADHFAVIERKVAKTFNNAVQSNSSSRVESSGEAPSKVRMKNFNDLPEYHKNIVRNLEKTVKNFQIDNYIKQLRAVGEI